MICRSKHGLAKIAVIESIPLVMGATFGGIGRLSGEHWIPAVPIVADFMTTAAVYDTPRGMWGLVKYGVGVSLAYSDLIYAAAQRYL